MKELLSLFYQLVSYCRSKEQYGNFPTINMIQIYWTYLNVLDSFNHSFINSFILYLVLMMVSIEIPGGSRQDTDCRKHLLKIIITFVYPLPDNNCDYSRIVIMQDVRWTYKEVFKENIKIPASFS